MSGGDGVRGRDGLYAPGDLVRARFRIEELIGRGGMGEVYRVEDLSSGERLAIKVIQPELLGSTKTRARFAREVEHTRRITHPNVVHIDDLFYEPPPDDPDGEPMPCLVMEHLRGETLADRLGRRGALTVEEARPLVCQMAAALAAAHRAGIVHRDLKPDNVFLVPAGAEAEDGETAVGEAADSEAADADRPRADRTERVVLTDFGVAREEQAQDLDESQLTGTDVLLGTPAYMAPEQLDLEEAIPASDLYALGLVAYQMVSARLPFEGDQPLETLLRRVREPPTPLREHCPGIDPEFEATVMHCLERDPRRRPDDAEDVIRQLDPRSPLLRRRGPRTEHLVFAGIVVALVAITALLVWFYAGV